MTDFTADTKLDLSAYKVDASRVAEAIVAKLTAQVPAGLAMTRAAGTPLVTVSAGAAFWRAGDSPADAQRLLDEADAAMYAVKPHESRHARA